MIAAVDIEIVTGFLRMEVALQAEVGVTLGEHLLIDGTVRVVAVGAAITNRFVLEGEDTGLDGMALGAGVVGPGGGGAARVRVMAIAAGHLAGEHGMAVGHGELGLLVEMALEAGVGRTLRIDDGARAAAGFDVFGAGAVTGLAADVFGILALGLEPGVICGLEVADELFMALGAGFGADEGGTGDGGWGHHGAGSGRARHEDDGK